MGPRRAKPIPALGVPTQSIVGDFVVAGTIARVLVICPRIDITAPPWHETARKEMIATKLRFRAATTSEWIAIALALLA